MSDKDALLNVCMETSDADAFNALYELAREGLSDPTEEEKNWTCSEQSGINDPPPLPGATTDEIRGRERPKRKILAVRGRGSAFECPTWPYASRTLTENTKKGPLESQTSHAGPLLDHWNMLGEVKTRLDPATSSLRRDMRPFP